MPTPKHPCPQCGTLCRGAVCIDCYQPYERTEDHRKAMSERNKGKRHHWPSGSTKPEVAAKIAAWWTPERRDDHSKKLLAKNPDSRYHGLSARRAARLVKEAGKCERCDHDGSQSRLCVHHKDRDKRNQNPENLEVLCWQCHMKEHKQAGETGWGAYHAKKREGGEANA